MKLPLLVALSAALLLWAHTSSAQQEAPRPGADSHAAHHVIPASETIAGESIYQLDIGLTLSDGTRMPLRSLRGRPVLISMFYSTCDGVCPLLAFTMRRILAAVPEPQCARMVLLMVSFDPGRDGPEALGEFSRLNQLNPPSGLAARTDERDVRELAAVLGIRYRELPGGIFSHSAVISLLDEEGVIRARTTTLQEIDPALMSAIQALKH